MSSKRAMRQAQKQAYAKHRSNITNSRFELKKKFITKNKEDIKKHEQTIKHYWKSTEQLISKNKTLSESISDERTIRGEIDTLLGYQRDIEEKINKEKL